MGQKDLGHYPIEFPQMDLTMTDSYAEDETVGKDIIQEFFTKQRLTAKQPRHRLWVNNKETRTTPPDLDHAQSDKIIDLTVKEETVNIPPQPGLAMPMPMDIDNGELHHEVAAPQPELPAQGGDTIVDVDNEMETNLSTGAYKPTHRLVGIIINCNGKQSPPHPVRAIVAQLDDIENTKEIKLENNEDKEEKRQMESIMSDVQ
eukprot:5241647-Amphidinium_carterae.1